MVFSFDYIKTSSDYGSSSKTEWQVVGELVDKFKTCISKEIVEDGEPIISMVTSVQSNRSGITNNRNSQNVVDDESIVSLSDRITQFCSHLFLLRKKVADEIHLEGDSFGTHKLINLKARHMGKSALRGINPVEMPDGSNKNNYLNLKIQNFRITEIGDLQDYVDTLNNDDVRVGENDTDNDMQRLLST